MTVSSVYPPAPEGACRIPLGKSRCVLVDADDYERVRAHRWHFTGHYAARVMRMNGKWRRQFLHHFLLPTPDGFEVDYRNGDKLDCRHANLRLATTTENHWNRGLMRVNTSGYKGVTWDKRKRRWRAQIQTCGKNRFLGYFDTPEEAALAYNDAAIALCGSFAWLNEVDGAATPRTTTQRTADAARWSPAPVLAPGTVPHEGALAMDDIQRDGRISVRP